MMIFLCRTTFWLTVAAFTLSVSTALSQQEKNFAIIRPGESLQEIIRKAANVTPSARQLAWQRHEFIAFAHFGMNTFMDQEWGRGTESPSAFNPTDFDARQWVKVIKDAGMKLLIITAKHHDGFCLWPSKHTDHSVKNSPWKGGKGDVVGEVARACREAGLKFGVYLSPWDRHEPTYGDSPVYNEHFRSQLRELLTNYGDISEVWFDGANGEGPNGKKQIYDWPAYYKVIRELQPQAVIAIMGPDVRWVGTESGYGRETEWSVVPNITQNLDAVAASSQQFPVDAAFAPKDLMADDLGSRERIKNASSLVWYPAETDVSIRPGWFYHSSQDNLVKSPAKLVDIYYSSVGRNSVLLLNIPPDKRGRISDRDIKSLVGMRKILEQTFQTNLASGATILASNEKPGYRASAVIEPHSQNYWTTDDGVEFATLEFELPGERTFDRLMLQENIRVGQRIESFRLEAWSANGWKTIARGTTVGYKRLLLFPAATCQKVRLVIDSSRTSPTLSNVGLYKSPPAITIEPNGGSFEGSLRVRLSSDSKNSTIYYTLNGSEPTFKSERYTEPIGLTSSAQVKAVASVGGELAAESSEARFTKCLKVKSVVFERPSSAKYAGRGDATIIDGSRGSLDFANKDWLGFNGDDVVATLDLGKLKSIHSITVGFLQQQGSWIFLPTEVKFFMSADGISWKTVGEQRNVLRQTERVIVKDYSCVVENVSARFVKITSKNVGTCPPWHPGAGNKAWLFVDEAIVE
jgi:alpha-L-fucosidase